MRQRRFEAGDHGSRVRRRDGRHDAGGDIAGIREDRDPRARAPHRARTRAAEHGREARGPAGRYSARRAPGAPHAQERPSGVRQSRRQGSGDDVRSGDGQARARRPQQVTAAAHTFELLWRGGATASRLHRRRPGLDAMPWGTLELARYTAPVAAEARALWTSGVFTEYASAAAFSALTTAMLESGAPIDL